MNVEDFKPGDFVGYVGCSKRFADPTMIGAVGVVRVVGDYDHDLVRVRWEYCPDGRKRPSYSVYPENLVKVDP